MLLSTVSKIRRATEEMIYDTIDSGYQRLDYYLTKLCEDNPGSSKWFEKINQNGRFSRAMFIPGCFKSSMTTCKPVICLDTCHLKGIYNKSGVFLTASVRDGNHCNLLIALAIVPQENTSEWKWFLHNLNSCDLSISKATVFMSDRFKGILEAVAHEFPESLHRFCMFHICLSIKANCGGLTKAGRAKVMKVAASENKQQFEKNLNDLQQEYPRASRYLVAIPPGNWVQCCINDNGFATLGVKTANTAENNNHWMGVLMRASDPVTVFYMYICKLLRLFKKRRHAIFGKHDDEMVPMADRCVQYAIKWSGSYEATSVDGNENVKFLVRHVCHSEWTKGKTNMVTCGKWQDSWIPCHHAYATTKPLRIPTFYTYRAQKFCIMLGFAHPYLRTFVLMNLSNARQA
ncbi:hypothetical protein LEN26_013642 [Aphanomyces euteiches]|nr:hypothetical protein LEN26_013642 [Aphanomyces euteiches]KAH9124639.1 hypothetical protein AeMF1_004657 [Aphanomyces euteiches]